MPGEAAHFAPRDGAPTSAHDGAPGAPNTDAPLGDLASHGGGPKINGAPSSAAGGPGGDSSLYDPGSEVRSTWMPLRSYTGPPRTRCPGR